MLEGQTPAGQTREPPILEGSGSKEEQEEDPASSPPPGRDPNLPLTHGLERTEQLPFDVGMLLDAELLGQILVARESASIPEALGALTRGTAPTTSDEDPRSLAAAARELEVLEQMIEERHGLAAVEPEPADETLVSARRALAFLEEDLEIEKPRRLDPRQAMAAPEATRGDEVDAATLLGPGPQEAMAAPEGIREDEPRSEQVAPRAHTSRAAGSERVADPELPSFLVEPPTLRSRRRRSTG